MNKVIAPPCMWDSINKISISWKAICFFFNRINLLE